MSTPNVKRGRARDSMTTEQERPGIARAERQAIERGASGLVSHRGVSGSSSDRVLVATGRA